MSKDLTQGEYKNYHARNYCKSSFKSFLYLNTFKSNMSTSTYCICDVTVMTVGRGSAREEVTFPEPPSAGSSSLVLPVQSDPNKIGINILSI